MVEIGIAISMATSAYKMIKQAVELGREAEDMADYFGKFFDAKDEMSAASQSSKNQPLVKKLFSGSSVEAQALEVTAGRYKIAKIEAELKEFLIYSGQGDFYEDMMKERRTIRTARLQEAARKAENKKMWIDVFSIAAIIALSGGILYILLLILL
jgi:hypothetical protein